MTNMNDMTSHQPYMLRAFYDWIVDNNLTPYMVVAANFPNVEVPQQFVNNGQIVLNVSPSACVNFAIDLDMVSFNARFSGQPMVVCFPCKAVAAIYAKENGAGTAFEVPSFTKEENTSQQNAIETTNKPVETNDINTKPHLQGLEASESSKSDVKNSPKKSKATLKIIK